MFGYFRDLNLCLVKSRFLRSSKNEQKRREKKLCGETSPTSTSIATIDSYFYVCSYKAYRLTHYSPTLNPITSNCY